MTSDDKQLGTDSRYCHPQLLEIWRS